MKSTFKVLSMAAVMAAAFTTSAYADVLRSEVAFNNGIAEKTSDQPEDGVRVSYQITLNGGDLDGCRVDIVEALFPRDSGAWGIFDIKGNVTCDSGGLSYTSSGSWDSNGFHASGDIQDGSGDYKGASGRVVQLGGNVADGGNGTLDVAYSLVFDLAK